ncbi:hypothetical protein ACFCXC_14940 [Streptomyces microflavus]|uniref:hypothetical protein n=1 Tax=Streptomyces microflavus TaxID=1919 RepID=UPI0035D6B3F9
MPTSPTPADRPAWVDGDPLMEATAAAVWEQCRTENSIVVDDPRNIAAVAATVARQLLGTTEAEGEPEPCGSLSQPTYSGEIMRCVLPVGHPRQCQSTTEYPWVSWPSPTAQADLLVTEMHRLALSEALGLGTGAPWDAIRERAAELAVAPPAPADRAAHYREAADIAESLREFNSPSLARNAAQVSENVGILRVADRLRRLAVDAAAGVQPPTSEAETEAPEDATRRFARRLHAVELLCSGRPGYHTITVKALLTAMGEADDEQPAAPAAPEEPTR